jgi:hypothetical protein
MRTRKAWPGLQLLHSSAFVGSYRTNHAQPARRMRGHNQRRMGMLRSTFTKHAMLCTGPVCVAYAFDRAVVDVFEDEA